MKLACDYFVNRVNACVNIFLSRVNALLTHTLSAGMCELLYGRARWCNIITLVYRNLKKRLWN